MAKDWKAGIDNLDDQGLGPSAVNQLSALGLDPDMVRANPELLASVSAPPGSPAATPPNQQSGPMAELPTGQPPQPPSEPAGSAAPAQPLPAASKNTDSPYAMAIGGLRNLQNTQKMANEATEGVPTSDPALEKLTAQRNKLATPVSLYDPQTGKMKDQVQVYNPETGQMDTINPKASTGRKIWRGIRGGLVGFLAGGIPGAGLGAIDPGLFGQTKYGAPTEAYQQAQERNAETLGATDTAAKDELANWKQAVDAAKVKSGMLTESLEGAGKLATTAAGMASTGANLRQHGLAIDQAGNIQPVPEQELSPGEAAKLEMDRANTTLAKARADLAEAQSDPNSPAYRLAMARIETAQRNADAAAVRANAYALNATGANLGTDTAGKPLQGSTVLSGTPVGSRFQSTVQNQQGRVAQFNDVLGATRTLEATARQLVSKEGKNALSSPTVAAALAEPDSTYGKWIQGQVATGRMTPLQRNYVTNLRAYRENLQALRKSAGGGVSDAQVDRLMEMAPGAGTPDLDYLLRQTAQIRATANRLAEGIPNVTGGIPVEGNELPISTPSVPASSSKPKQKNVFEKSRRID